MRAAWGLLLPLLFLTGCSEPDAGSGEPTTEAEAEQRGTTTESESEELQQATAPTDAAVPRAEPAVALLPYDSRERYAALALPPLSSSFMLDVADEELALARRLATEEADAILEPLDPEERVRTLRIALQLPGSRAAWVAARELDWKWLDVEEQRRATLTLARALVSPELFDVTAEELEGSYWHMLEHAGAADVPELLRLAAATPADRLEHASVAIVHKFTHAEHLPLLGELLGPEHRDWPDSIHELWALVEPRTDRNRLDIVRAWRGDRWLADLPPSAGELPAALTELLREAIPSLGEEPPHGTLRRWLRDSSVAQGDARLLLSLIDATDAAAVPLWKLRRLRDDASLAVLNEYRDEGLDLGAAALGALAHRGDPTALGELAAQADADGVALGLLFELDADRGRAVVLERFLRGDEEVVYDLHTALWEVRPWFALEWHADELAPLQAELLEDAPDLASLSFAAEVVPAFWNRRFAAGLLARLPPAEEARALDPRRVPDPDEGVIVEWDEHEAPWWSHSVILELGAPDAFREWLTEWGRVRGPLGHEVPTLLAMGDATRTTELIDWVRRNATRETWDLELLARSPTEEVRAYLEALVRGEERLAGEDPGWTAVHALALLHGLPEGVEFTPADMDDEGTSVTDPDLWDRMEELVLAGRPVDAFALQCQTHHDLPWWNAGDVDDPRITAYLEGLQRRRHLGYRPWATAELAIAGDRGARAETWTAIERGHYRWCDHLDARQSTLGHDFGLVPHWIDFTEASCCQHPTATTVIRWLLPLDDGTGGARFTDADLYRRWWREWAPVGEGKFVESRLDEQDHWWPRPR